MYDIDDELMREKFLNVAVLILELLYMNNKYYWLGFIEDLYIKLEEISLDDKFFPINHSELEAIILSNDFKVIIKQGLNIEILINKECIYLYLLEKIKMVG